MNSPDDLLWEYDEAIRKGENRAWNEFLDRAAPDRRIRNGLLCDLFRVAAQHRGWNAKWIRETVEKRPEFQEAILLAELLRGLYCDQIDCGSRPRWEIFSRFGLGAETLNLRQPGEPLALGICLEDTYSVRQRIGVGAFGVVYRAIKERTGAAVALKGGWQRWDEEARRTARLLREEARLLDAARGPGVPALLDVLSVDESPILVLEFIDGATLSELIENSAVGVQEAANIIRSVAEVIERSHKHGHVHRDLKPENVLVRGDGEVFVIDFGIGLREETQFSDCAARAGTVRYMAPECVVQNVTAIDERADIWSLGVVFYEVLVGKVLFENETKESVWVESAVGSHLGKLEEADIDDGIKAIIRRCLAYDRRKRFMTMGALKRALADWCER